MDHSLKQAIWSTRLTWLDNLFALRGTWVAHLLLVTADLVLVFCGFLLAYWMRYMVDWAPPFEQIFREVATVNQVPFSAFLPVTLLLMFVLLVLFETRGLYRKPHNADLIDYIGTITSSTLIGIALLIVVVFLYRPFYYSRLIFPVAGLNIIVLLSLWRACLLALRRWSWEHNIGQQRVLVVGGRDIAREVMAGIYAQSRMGYRLAGYLDQRTHPLAPDETPAPYLGSVEHLADAIRTHRVREVILALPASEHALLPQLVQVCRTHRVGVHIAPDLPSLSFDRIDVQHISGVPLLELKEVSIRGWNLAFKRALDMGLILLTAPLTVPISLFLTLIIRLDSSGPALFRQERVGKNGQLFTCYKFRTMVQDAEKLKAELSKYNEADGPLFKIRRDPRVTRVGRWLRRSSLDELPQLWNVLIGDMSLVGPRPALPNEVACYEPWHRRRLEVLPGLTGLWQVLGRSNTTFDEMVRLDIYYAENWTIGMDVSILARTIPAVLLGRGAY